MKVNGIEISNECIEAILSAMSREPISYNRAQTILKSYGVPMTTAYRAADRIFQKLRKEGRARHTRGRGWEAA